MKYICIKTSYSYMDNEERKNQEIQKNIGDIIEFNYEVFDDFSKEIGRAHV